MGVVQDQKGTVVVVDDEPNIADLVDLYLAREGFRVLKTGTGEAGLRAVKDHRPRLVVLDVGLPDVDGLEVCKRLRATSRIPVIFLTARDSEVDRVLGLELGGDDYLTKPFSPAELVARVKAVLRRVDGGPAPEVM
jgi:two-component system, OmpR family, response regulator